MTTTARQRAAQLLSASSRAVALTGAGISTPSGIADFRTPGTGMWSQVDPMEVASIDGFRRDPSRFYRWFSGAALDIARAQPNPAHHALAELEHRGVLRAVVTQNIDRLHQRAGSQHVIELHGALGTATCLRCGARREAAPLLDRFVEVSEVPHCSCGGVFKPDVVFFGEMLPLEALRRSQEEIASCDLLLVVGSSLTVAPASQLPWLAVGNATPIIVCNLTETWADAYAAHAGAVLREDVALSLPGLLQGW